MPDAAPDTVPGAPGADPTSADYRFAPSVVARLVGVAVLLLAVVVLVATALAALAALPTDVVVVLAAVGLLAVLGLGWWLRTLAVLRFDDTGYRVRMVRGAGTKQAAWTEVQEAVTASPRGIRCLVLRLVDGRSTTVPVDVLAVDGDRLVRELQVRLRRGEGLRPL